jgi:Ca-activated chloride channel family protein
MSKLARTLIVNFAFFLTLLGGLAWAFIVLGPEITALRWDRPWFFLGLVAVPVVLVLTTIGEDTRVPRLRVGSIKPARAIRVGWRARLRDVPGAIRASALVLLTIALAKPQTVTAAEMDERSGIDVMMVLDLSESMQAADLKPSRIGAAKAVIQEFIERRQDDRIGAVVFGTDAFVLSPLTLDHARLASLVGKMDVGKISGKRTAIGEGLGAALAKLKASQAESRVVILLTDGESNAGEMSPETAMEIAKKLGVKMYTVQMGNGDEVDFQVDTDPWGRPIYGRARFPVNPALLKKIATETGGESYISTDAEQLRSSMHQILDKLPKTRFEAASGDVVERYPLVLIPGALLVIVEALMRALVLRRFP